MGVDTPPPPFLWLRGSSPGVEETPAAVVKSGLAGAMKKGPEQSYLWKRLCRRRTLLMGSGPVRRTILG